MTHFSETTQTGFFARIKKAVSGIGLGLAFIGIAIYFLFWNEGNSVRLARALNEGAGQVISLDDTVPDPIHEGNLVHIGGPLTLPDPLTDVALGVSGTDQTVRLERRVEQFAWIEKKRSSTETKTGGTQEKTTEYTYYMDWTDSPDSGANFRITEGHMNPPMPVRSKVIRHKEGRIGGFVLSDRVSDLGGAEAMLLNADQARDIEQALSLERPARLVAGQVVFANDIAAPQLGDLRISYAKSDIATASVVGVQKGAHLVPYIAKNGRQIHLFEAGLVTAEDMFELSQSRNRFKTWMLRLGLMLLMFLGFKAVLSIIDVLASILPFLGWISASITSLVSLALTLFVGGGTMAIAWFYFRPLLSITLLLVTIGGAIAVALYARKSASTARDVTSPAPPPVPERS